MKTYNNMSTEVAQQFNQIFSEHHSFENRDKKQIERKRKKRIERIKQDVL